MTTKMKGLFKGLRYISHIFEEEKEDEIQIGLPTDVKHVAHIGWDGPTVHESPSWMKEFNSQSALKSAPLGPPTGEPREEPEVKWVSEDSKRGQRATESPGIDSSDVPRSSRRQSSGDSNSNDSPRKKDSKSRHSRRPHSKDKDSSESSVKSNRNKIPEPGPPGSIPDIPKKSRRKKSKESNGENGGGSSRGKSRRAPKNSDPEIANDSIEQIPGPKSNVTDDSEEK